MFIMCDLMLSHLEKQGLKDSLRQYWTEFYLDISDQQYNYPVKNMTYSQAFTINMSYKTIYYFYVTL
jgi:hypothetical protein